MKGETRARQFIPKNAVFAVPRVRCVVHGKGQIFRGGTGLIRAVGENCLAA
jgi:hypothetical protein